MNMANARLQNGKKNPQIQGSSQSYSSSLATSNRTGGSCLIPLTQNQFAIVDSEDFAELSKHKWYAYKDYNVWYALTAINFSTVSMHRIILNAKKGQFIDHANGNGLDNRKENLRFCTPRQNSQNARKCKTPKTSKYKGVWWRKDRNRWVAEIMLNNKSYHLGCFTDEIECAKSYDRKALELFGEFARTNF